MVQHIPLAVDSFSSSSSERSGAAAFLHCIFDCQHLQRFSGFLILLSTYSRSYPSPERLCRSPPPAIRHAPASPHCRCLTDRRPVDTHLPGQPFSSPVSTSWHRIGSPSILSLYLICMQLIFVILCFCTTSNLPILYYLIHTCICLPIASPEAFSAPFIPLLCRLGVFSSPGDII